VEKPQGGGNMMLRIVIDFDETLFPTLEKVVETYNKRNNANIELSQITTYSLYDCFPADIADEIIALFVDKSIYNNLQPYKGSVKAVKTLADKGYEIYVATATDIKNMEWKEKLLQRYFPFIPKENLIRIHNKKLLNVDVLVEDKLDNLIQTFAERVCFNQPWNQDKETDYVCSIYRIHHWGEIINVINDIERKNKEWEK
jgi:5'(3')-deoxyribonucleotidase